MRNLKLAAAASVLLLSACTSVHRHDGSAVYVPKAMLETLEFPAAPAPGSPEDQADYAVLRDWLAKRTPQQCAEAAKESNALLEDFFGDLKPFKSALPKPGREFIMRYREDISTAVDLLKAKNARQRPFHSDAALTCIGRAGGLAYPSGHATLSRAFALLLAELRPARRAEFLARADEAALYRVIGGVHHPSDIEAGKLLADTLFPKFMENPAFRAQLEKLRPYAAD
jgi:acid phosphatase (class A)